VLRRIEAGLPADEDEEDFDQDFEEEEELETVAEVVEAPKIPAPPTGGGLSLEEQIRLLEGGGATPPPPQAAGLSLEEQMKLLEGGEADEEEEEAPPTPRAKPVTPEKAEEEESERFEFEEPLRQLVMEVPGGIAGSIVGFDGIEVASFSTDPDFQTIIADAELAGIMSTVKKAAQSLAGGKPQEAYFATERYGFVLKAVRDQFFVSLVLEAKELNLGLTRLHISKIVPLIEAELF
jgi:predicted regulator of Ras-like GTPase activity (Roadblock/LC7/MglB family)